MDKNAKKITSCRSIFKDGKTTPSREAFTKKWIEMVNQIEKAKSVVPFHS